MKLLHACLVAASLSLNGCYYLSGQYATDQENARLAYFMNQDTTVLIKTLGAPTMTMDDGKGGKIWVYRTTSESVNPGRTETTYDKKTGTATTESYPGSVSVSTLEELFFVNAAGKVYDTAWHNK
ncbi:MAG: hypothetical protein JWM80_3942 [Cyanobacteria bacterium RYN_339]|nr:hypothetical protein [Cyanobacteria bacterium RYN_339]